MKRERKRFQLIVGAVMCINVFFSASYSFSAQQQNIASLFSLLLGYEDAPDICNSPKSPNINILDLQTNGDDFTAKIDEIGDRDFYRIYTPNFYRNTTMISFKANVHAVIYDENCKVVDDQTGFPINPDQGYGVRFLLPPGKTFYLEVFGNAPPLQDVTSSYEIIAETYDGFAYLTALAGTDPSYIESQYAPDPEGPYHPEFGETRYLLDSDTLYGSVSKVYYATVDPQGKRTTLDDWLFLHGFIDSDGQEIQGDNLAKAEYINAHDLGLGRKMRCLKESNLKESNGGNDVFPCVVENFLIGSNPDEPEHPQKILSVAMEHTPVKDPIFEKYYTAFYVFDASGQRINAVDLDGSGAKRVPESCWSCHFGYSSDGHGSHKGIYLPFDVKLYRQFPGGPTIESQEEAFKALNNIVYQVFLSTPEIDWPDDYYSYQPTAELIEYWYDGPPDSSNSSPVEKPSKGIKFEIESFPIDVILPASHGPGTAKAEFYANYCRICHVSTLANNARPYENDDCQLCHTNAYNDPPDNARKLETVICDTVKNFGDPPTPPARQMPNAKVTHQRLRENELDDDGEVIPGSLLSQLRDFYPPFCSEGPISKMRRD